MASSYSLPYTQTIFTYSPLTLPPHKLPLLPNFSPIISSLPLHNIFAYQGSPSPAEIPSIAPNQNCHTSSPGGVHGTARRHISTRPPAYVSALPMTLSHSSSSPIITTLTFTFCLTPNLSEIIIFAFLNSCYSLINHNNPIYKIPIWSQSSPTIILGQSSIIQLYKIICDSAVHYIQPN